jgi:VanZ family protein
MLSLALGPLRYHDGLRRAALWLWGTLVAAIIVLSLMPDSGPPSEFFIDKLLHGLGYGSAAGLPFLAFRERHPVYVAACLMLPMGLVLEILQDYIPGRVTDAGDAVANTAGVLIGLTFGPLARRLANFWFGIHPDAAPSL